MSEGGGLQEGGTFSTDINAVLKTLPLLPALCPLHPLCLKLYGKLLVQQSQRLEITLLQVVLSLKPPFLAWLSMFSDVSSPIALCNLDHDPYHDLLASSGSVPDVL